MADPFFRTYQPDLVSVTFGALIMTGFAQDSMITVARKTPTWTSTVGSQGYVTRAKTLDRRGDITITLDMSSPSNDDLMSLFNADEKTGKGALSFIMVDGSGSTVVSAPAAWIVQPATIEMGGAITARQWTFEAANLEMYVGGNR